ncbi:hypothetical protein ACN47E_000938 [Coniothyrium glycines]
MLYPPALFSILLAAAAVAEPDTQCPRYIGAAGVRARLPPAFEAAQLQSSWNPPPVGWYFKHWNMIYASNQQYAAFRNLQYDPTAIDPEHPEGLVNDLFSFQLPGNDTIYTTYGIDTPNPDHDAVLDYNATGIIAGATSEYSLLAWGCDSNKIPYYASYSTATEMTNTPAGIDIMSTVDEGPDSATIDALLQALKDLPNAEIHGLAVNLTKMAQDGGRDGLPSVTCDDYCKTNQNLIEILG